MKTLDKSKIIVVDDCHDLLKCVIPVLDIFPRAHCFTLGERLE